MGPSLFVDPKWNENKERLNLCREAKPSELFRAPKEERTKQFLNRIRPELNYSI